MRSRPQHGARHGASLGPAPARRLNRSQEVARREVGGIRAAAELIDLGPTGPGIHPDVAYPQKCCLRAEQARENHPIGIKPSLAFRGPDHDGLNPFATFDRHDFSTQQERHAKQTRQQRGGPAGGGALTGLDHRDRADAGMPAGQEGGKRDKLGPQHDRAPERPHLVKVDKALERPGRKNSARFRPADEASGAARFPRACSQQDLVGDDVRRP
jgi:hypothetical protein